MSFEEIYRAKLIERGIIKDEKTVTTPKSTAGSPKAADTVTCPECGCEFDPDQETDSDGQSDDYRTDDDAAATSKEDRGVAIAERLMEAVKRVNRGEPANYRSDADDAAATADSEVIADRLTKAYGRRRAELLKGTRRES
jgi:predicted  nucleic acid-binding Zn-ribbon protein